MKKYSKNLSGLKIIFFLIFFILASGTMTLAFAQLPLIYSFDGLPDSYNGEAGENWQGHHYYATYFDAGASVTASTLTTRTIDGVKYICAGWKNGKGSIGSPAGSTSSASFTINEGTSLTWVYIRQVEFKADIDNLGQTIWGFGDNSFAQVVGETKVDSGSNVTILPSGMIYTPTQNYDKGSDWLMVSSGYRCGFGIKKDGSLWQWGMYGGQDFPTTVHQVGTDRDWVYINSDFYTSYALKSDRSLWKISSDGSAEHIFNDVSKFADGYDYLLHKVAYQVLIKTDGTLWAKGENNYGELGDGTTEFSAELKKIGNDFDWADISAFTGHTMALKKDGTLWCWGRNDRGQIGDNSTINVLSPKEIMPGTKWKAIVKGRGEGSAAIRDDGTLWTWGDTTALGRANVNSYIPIQVGTDKDWAEVAAGDGFMVGLKSDGRIFGWGRNELNQLGLGDGAGVEISSPVQIGTDNDWLMVDAGSDFVLGIRSQYRVRFSFYPNFGSKFYDEGTEISAHAEALPFGETSSFTLGSWIDGYGDLPSAQGCTKSADFTLNQDSGLKWRFVPGAGTVNLKAGLAPGIPDKVGEADGFVPVLNTEIKKSAACIYMTAPAEIVIPGTEDRWVCTGWSATGLNPSSGSGNVISISDSGSVSENVSVQWKYAIENDSNPSVTINVKNGFWNHADVKVSKTGYEAGTWGEEINVTSADNIKSFEKDSTIKISADYGFVDNSKNYKATGLKVNTSGFSSPVTKNISGDRVEFIITLRQDLDVEIQYVNTNEVTIGSPLSPPPGSNIDAWTEDTWESKIIAFQESNPADTKTSAFFFDNKNKKLYPVRPSLYFEIDWDGTGIGMPYQAVWGEASVKGIITGTPVNLQPETATHSYKAIHISESYDYETWKLVDNKFIPSKPGKTLIRFEDKDKNPVFLTVEAVSYEAPLTFKDAVIGTEITDSEHDDPEGKTGYLFNELCPVDSSNTDKVYDRDTRQGEITPVNTGDPGTIDDDIVVIWYKKGLLGVGAEIGWPFKVSGYNPVWPADSKTIVIASGNGAGLLPEYKLKGKIYIQDNRTKAGYNPNEEHAVILGNTVYAIRSDLNTYKKDDGTWTGPFASGEEQTSKPYVLLKYEDPETGKIKFDVYKVEAESVNSSFSYETEAGKMLSAPTPLDLLPVSDLSSIYSGHNSHHKDHKGNHWAKSETKTGTPLLMNWYYPLQAGFYYPDALKAQGDDIPFMAWYKGGDGSSPYKTSYKVVWPDDIPVLKIGETLISAKAGLPDISSMAYAKIIFDEKGENQLARIIEPFAERSVSLESVPENINTESKEGKIYFSDLPFSISERLFYDPIAVESSTGKKGKLIFKGVKIDTGIGDPLLLPNIISKREMERIKSLSSSSQPWIDAVVRLFYQTRSVSTVSPGGTYALTSGNASGQGIIVLAENDDPSLGSEPVSLHLIRVEGGPVQGDIKVIKSDNPFDEKLVLRHSLDFGGMPENFYFKWYYKPDSGGIPPKLPTGNPEDEKWIPFGDEGWGLNDITIEGPGKLTLSDNWFIVKFYYGGAYKALVEESDSPSDVGGNPTDTGDPDKKYWSSYSGAPGGETAQLAEGWIKRVVGDLNPLDARVKDFRNYENNTETSLIAQLGERYEGDIALNGSAENLNKVGLIEAYETILKRGSSFSIDGAVPVDYGPANTALLNAATRIAGFYTLLGNEAYADAQDPSIAFNSADGETGQMNSSMFAFKNQLGSLLDEELDLLRGRDDILSTTKAAPVYNRLIWNFTNGEGEIAYVMNYNVSDIDYSGVIDELDAKKIYPQGHGDAWGHYLSAMTVWYSLLRHPHYTWEPRVESVLVGGAPVPVDYLDERKFASTAAAKARAGAEIVDLTYRSRYVADSSGQWQGYKDTNSERAWGVDEWARRAGQGAFFDWVTANAMLPYKDENESHEGIQIIDRATVTELGQIADSFRLIQQQADEADAGLNPLGLAHGAVPFDIDPVKVEGNTGANHFEQIYERAVSALENADNAFKFASKYTLIQRSNEDNIANFKSKIEAQENEYQDRLIEIFGYPYSGDIGGSGTYPDGYDGPDLFHYMYMDTTRLTGIGSLENKKLKVPVKVDQSFENRWGWYTNSEIKISTRDLDLEFPITDEQGPWIFTAGSSWGERRAGGEIQQAISDIISAKLDYKLGLKELDGILANINTATDILQAQYGISKDNIQIITEHNGHIIAQRTVATELGLARSLVEFVADINAGVFDGIAEMVPDTFGTANSVGAPAKGTVNLLGVAVTSIIKSVGQGIGLFEENLNLSADIVEMERDRIVSINDARAEVQQMAKELETMHYEAEAKIIELYSLALAMNNSLEAYKSVLTEGENLLSEREDFRAKTAGQIQDYRYQDWGFRIFKNDAVQKYRATFDLAARYAYLAAAAYDYETNKLGTDTTSGQSFLSSIVKHRSPGEISGGTPVAGGSGLSDPLARLHANFNVYKTQLGLNNPQLEINTFSLRNELFRIRSGSGSDAVWKAELQGARIDDLLTFPPFVKHCRKFAQSDSGPQPGLVIPFSTEITFGRNFFGWPLGAGDSSFDPSNFSTKLRGVGIKFENYAGAGLSNTPRVYLVPVGADMQRTPDDEFLVKKWNVADQKLPVPYPISESDFNEAGMIPVNDLLSDDFLRIRKHSGFKCFYDGSAQTWNTGLTGRSVWNTQWLLIIPGGTLLNDPDQGLNSFIANVKDIQVNMSTYSSSGN